MGKLPLSFIAVSAIVIGLCCGEDGPSAEPAPQESPLGTVIRLPNHVRSEGLDFYAGRLWQSKAYPHEILELDPLTAQVLRRHDSPTQYPESLVWIDDQLIHLDFRSAVIYRGQYDGVALRFSQAGLAPEVGPFGSAFDGTHLIISGNFSNRLYFLDPNTFAVVRTLETDLPSIEDLAWDGNQIWASSAQGDRRGIVYTLAPDTGRVLGTYPIPGAKGCWIDGIALQGDQVFVAGKNCGWLYGVDLKINLPKP